MRKLIVWIFAAGVPLSLLGMDANNIHPYMKYLAALTPPGPSASDRLIRERGTQMRQLFNAQVIDSLGLYVLHTLVQEDLRSAISHYRDTRSGRSADKKIVDVPDVATYMDLLKKDSQVRNETVKLLVWMAFLQGKENASANMEFMEKVLLSVLLSNMPTYYGFASCGNGCWC